MSSREQVPGPKAVDVSDDEATATAAVPAPAAPNATDPSIDRGATVVQDFSDDDLPGREATVRLRPVVPKIARLGEQLEHTPVGPDPATTARQAPVFAHLLGESLETTPVAPGPGVTIPAAFSGGGPQDELKSTVPAIVAPLGARAPEALRMTDPVAAPPSAPPSWSEPPFAPALQDPPAAPPERRPAPPAPPPVPIVRPPPALSPPSQPGSDDAPPTDPSPARRVPPRGPPAFAPEAPAGPPVDPLRLRRMRAMQGRLARLSDALIKKVEDKPPVWRVVALGIAAGLLVATAFLVFYFRGRSP